MNKPLRPSNPLATMGITAHVVRPADMLVLSLHFSGLRLVQSGRNVLLAANEPATDALLTVKFAPQSIGERTFAEGAPSSVKFPAAARLSGGSRCVFKLPAAAQPALLKTGVAFTLAEVLRLLESCDLISQSAEISPETDPAKLFQQTQTTLIEAPHRILLSPEADAVLRHSHIEANAAGRVPLWHTRVVRLLNLGRFKIEASAKARVPFGFPNSPETEVDGASPRRDQRQDIVKLTTASALGALRRSVQLNQLMLSALGAYLDAEGSWDLDKIKLLNNASVNKLNVRAWLHRLTLGRDQYVKVVEDGLLYPFGHPASLITITERKFRHENNGTGAYLRRRMLLIVRQPQVIYKNNRALPFTSVTLQTLVTPDLAPTVTPESNALVRSKDGKDVMFVCLAADWEGNAIRFQAPLVYLSKRTFQSATGLSDISVLKEYEKKVVAFDGQKVAMAEPEAEHQQGTTVVVKEMRFTAEGESFMPLVLRPKLLDATIEVRAVKALAGQSSPVMKYHPNWTDTTKPNAGQVFARFLEPDSITIPSDKAGGLLAPTPMIDGISRTLGAVAKADDLATGAALNAADLFKKADLPKLFGCIEIPQIVGGLDASGKPLKTLDSNQIPKLITEKRDEPNPGEAEITLYEWTVPSEKLSDVEVAGIFKFVPPSGSLSDAFRLETKIKNPLSGGTPTFLTTGKLLKFEVVLGDMVRLLFDELSFTSENAKKPDVSVKFNTIQFEGVLSFVNALTAVLPLDGFSDPPFLDVSSDGVAVGYTLGIPAVPMGAFNLSNMSLSASFFLPLFGKNPLALRFAFCEREQPCTLTVYGIGGGAFVAVVVSLKGVEEIEAAIEFGAAVAINLGVAAGTASIMAGIYMQKAGEELTLSGYLRANGHLSVLGLISVSVTLYMALAYQTNTGRVWGEAQVSVKVKVVFFNKTVMVRMEREFKGSDPSFEELMPRDASLVPGSPSTAWNTYWDAFA